MNAGAKAMIREVGFQAMRVKPINIALRRVARPAPRPPALGGGAQHPDGGEIHVDLEDGREIVLVSDGYDSLASRMYWSGIDGFEPESLRLFLHLSRRAEVIFDVGAHIGLYALLAAAGRPEVTTVAFEPVARNLGYLHGNVARNDADNITVVEAAVGARSGTVELRVPRRCGSRPPRRSPRTTPRRPGRGAAGVARRLRGRRGVRRVDLIKIDVEGAQYDVLRGAAA